MATRSNEEGLLTWGLDCVGRNPSGVRGAHAGLPMTQYLLPSFSIGKVEEGAIPQFLELRQTEALRASFNSHEHKSR